MGRSSASNPAQVAIDLGHFLASDRQKLEASWANRWLPVTILAIERNGGVKIHWEGWADTWDEVVPLDRLRLPAVSQP